MAFLDNSGDIILDAILTDLGRKRMARGNFRIAKFALGDDEINYGLYDTSHASGSAYYDLEILQTPVLESISGRSANINHGLLSIQNPNLYYMPVIKENNKVALAADREDNVYYLAVNDGATADALITAFGGSKGGGNLKVLQAGKRNDTRILLETGLDTEEIAATQTNKTNYITSNKLGDTGFSVSVDTRFISSVMGPSGDSRFNNNAGSGEANVKINLSGNPPITRDRSMRHHQMATVRAVANNVFKRQNDNKADTATSAIAGPRASITALNFDTKLLTTNDYQRYGKTGQTISGASGTYKYIDTNVMVRNTLGVSIQLPIRIIQKE
tara:strand:+ start:9259 stop:10245 length:987 start_codon:yes stop_codon:yes gene_type:complete